MCHITMIGFYMMSLIGNFFRLLTLVYQTEADGMERKMREKCTVRKKDDDKINNLTSFLGQFTFEQHIFYNIR